MEYKRFDHQIVLRVDRGDEVVSSILDVCKKEEVKLASISGIGAADYVSMGLFDVEEKAFNSIELKMPLEVTSIVGNITLENNELYQHIHVTVSDSEGKAYGGHLKELHISGTSEIFITVIDGSVSRKFDEETGLNLMSF